MKSPYRNWLPLISNLRSEKSGCPPMAAISGVIRSLTSAAITAAKAVPITTATASSTRLPLRDELAEVLEHAAMLTDPSAVTEALARERYLADPALATAVYLAAELEQPLLLEGEAGVGKTEVAKALAGATGAG